MRIACGVSLCGGGLGGVGRALDLGCRVSCLRYIWVAVLFRALGGCTVNGFRNAPGGFCEDAQLQCSGCQCCRAAAVELNLGSADAGRDHGSNTG